MGTMRSLDNCFGSVAVDAKCAGLRSWRRNIDANSAAALDEFHRSPMTLLIEANDGSMSRALARLSADVFVDGGIAKVEKIVLGCRAESEGLLVCESISSMR
jgi:hypothetical protein